MKDQAHARRPGGETGRSSNEPLSAWNTRLIEVITDVNQIAVGTTIADLRVGR